MSVAQAAEYCAVTSATLRRWIAEARIPAFRVGAKNIRLRIADVHAFMEEDPIIRPSRWG